MRKNPASTPRKISPARAACLKAALSWAVRATRLNGHPIARGEAIGLVDDKLTVASADVSEALLMLVERLGPMALGLPQRVVVAPGRLDQVGGRLAQVALLTGERSGLLGQAFSELGHGQRSTSAWTLGRGIAAWRRHRRRVPS